MVLLDAIVGRVREHRDPEDIRRRDAVLFHQVAVGAVGDTDPKDVADRDVLPDHVAVGQPQPDRVAVVV